LPATVCIFAIPLIPWWPALTSNCLVRRRSAKG